MADAGFNVIVPRYGAKDINLVRQVAKMCQKRGVFYATWIRGSRKTDKGNRWTPANGTVVDLYSPNSDELWDKISKQILEQVKLSVEIPSILGTFIDYECYSKKRVGNCYSLSYDDKIWSEFMTSKNMNVAKIPFSSREKWLVGKRLHSDFAKFQITSWRRRCKKLRQEIDKINPKFQLIVYPAPGSLMIKEAISKEWGTPQTPLVLAGVDTYFRKHSKLSKALKINRNRLQENMKAALHKNYSIYYIGGLDPIVKGGEPEFEGKSAVMISEISKGYWVFYEGPKYGKQDHKDCFSWFSRANRDIVKNDFKLWCQARETPYPAIQALQRKIASYLGKYTPKKNNASLSRKDQGSAFLFRRSAVFGVYLKKG